MNPLPPFALAERDALIAETYVAFNGVTREGGVSWSEAYTIDFCTPQAEEQAARQFAARASDLDTEWTQLLDDPSFHGDGETSAWSFLGPIGFRYYLPATMVRCLRGDNEYSPDSFIFHLTLREGDSRDYRLEMWSLLDLRQRRCMKRFLEYMDFLEGRHSNWEDALESYWKDVPDEDRSTATPR